MGLSFCSLTFTHPKFTLMKYLLSFFLALSAFASYACSCANPGVITDEQYDYYDFIARGTITSLEEGEVTNTFVLMVEDVYKEDQRRDEVALYTSSSSASCGIAVHEGEEWLIYAKRQDGRLHVSLCSRTVVLSAPDMGKMSERAKQDLEYLNKKEGMSLKVGFVERIYSDELGESRTLNIYLPEGYDKNKTYPVIYLLDGTFNEDFLPVAGLLKFSNYEWLDYMPDCILVGIENVDRKRDFTYPSRDEEYKAKYPTTGGSAAFIRFIENELKPFVGSVYPTDGTDIIIGQSLGGLLASEVLIKKPNLFDHYFIISPSLWYDDISLLEMEMPSEIYGSKSVFVAVGDEGKVMKKTAKKLYKKASKVEGLKVEFEYLKNEDHGSILLQALYSGFEDFRKRSGLISVNKG